MARRPRKPIPKKATAPKPATGPGSKARIGAGPKVKDSPASGADLKPDLVIDIKVPKTRRDLKLPVDKAPNLKPEAPPLALFPLSLEYRFVTREQPPVLKDTSKLREAVADLVKGRRTTSLKGRAAQAKVEKKVFDDLQRHGPVFRKAAPATEELWVRWYPEDSFADQGVAPATEDETAALSAFEAAIGAGAWWDMSDAAVSAEWQNFARAVGPARAVHLARGGGGDDAYPARIGRIAALPRKVALYALDGGRLTRLGEGGAIPRNRRSSPSDVAYTPDAAEPGGWLVDFEAAVAKGMGVKLTDPAALKLAKDADWIIAIGLSRPAGTREIEELFESQIANGDFSLLPQDAPTNNTPDAPSHLARPETDLGSFTSRASAAERGAIAANADADRLAEALDLPRDLLHRAVDADQTGFEDARAMLRVVGPALLDDALDGVSPVDGVAENTFIDILAASITARGPLPALRFGDAAMGVLPMSRIFDLKPPESGADSARGKVHKFLADYARIGRALLPGVAERRVPVIEPGDPEAPDKLFDILAGERVSKRIDVVANGGDKPQALGCPYVDGRFSQHWARTYLRALRIRPASDLPDPDRRDKNWPLLYRLARLSLANNTERLAVKGLGQKLGATRKEAEKRAGPEGARLRKAFAARSVATLATGAEKVAALSVLPQRALRQLTLVNRAYVDALKRLESIASRPNGSAELEVLLCEVVDLFQHRIDAFATGLAYARLKASREAGRGGLQAGYYGLLGKLRPQSETGGGDGYIQAPSMPQAVTAALLRSAYLRHRGDAAFQINLSSHRVRGALKLLDRIAKGHDLREVLGLRGERLLHDARKDRLILQLRLRFPLEAERGSNLGARRVFDGMSFIESDHGDGDLRALRTRLKDELDALADVVMAEATHQRALGRGAVANAWLSVLSGHPPPGRPEFLKTQRHGQGSSHRVSLLTAAEGPADGAAPREIAEPALAALARRMMPDFDAAALTVQLFLGDQPASPPTTIRLGEHLGMSPLDLIVGGTSEIEARGRHAIHVALAIDPPETSEGAARVAMTPAGPALQTTLDVARALQKAVQTGRTLEPGDLNAAAPAAAGELDEAAGIAIIGKSIDTLHKRMDALSRRMRTVLRALHRPFNDYRAAMSEAVRRRDADAGDAAVEEALARAEPSRLALMTALRDLAAFGAPKALRPIDSDAVLEDPETQTEAIGDMIRDVAGRMAALNAAVAAHRPEGRASLSVARRDLAECVAVLQGALDGEATPVLPPIPRDDPRLRPAIGAAETMEGALGVWATERPDLGRLTALEKLDPSLRAYPGADEATILGTDPDPDPRPEDEAPGVRHHAVFAARESDMRGAGPVAGIVLDEWSVERPSRTQMSGIAINYDSPQSEPPHCVLLGVPPHEKFTSWSMLRAAELVQETIAWSMIRALSSHDRLTPAALFPGSNLVPHRHDGEKATPRIPTRSIFDRLGKKTARGMQIAETDDAKGATLRDAPERRGFGRVKE